MNAVDGVVKRIGRIANGCPAAVLSDIIASSVAIGKARRASLLRRLNMI
jgi:hypothetical protein